ncbi:YdeI/OmpD-associated family protein [Paenibacillus sp. FJAT-27812]|uniref:YdeI/OmpD-associated family protein n=1 Tax=Paenibacillus sp. FJAT-27812 TaxID=1684143 RepID=UPI0006A78885|nr:YdeI/OmpD-associated family protein [Paenibacillus sp. FJAT-27812]
MKVLNFEAVLVKPAAVGAWTYVTVPFDVEEHFGQKSQVAASLAYSGQKECVSWIESAKKAETRIDRISKANQKLSGGQKLKS